MRWMMYQHNGVEGIAVSDAGAWHGVMADDAGFPGDLKAVIAQGQMDKVAAALMAGGDVVDPAQVTVLPPIATPSKCICIGLNYRAHVAEMGMDIPSDPTVFVRFASSFVGHGAPLVMPRGSEQFDYEVELAVIIGKAARGVSRDNALDHVAGYAAFNDGSVRDDQLRTSQWTLGKNHDATGAFGPWMVTPDGVPAGGSGLAIKGYLNGDVVQDGRTDDLVFDVPSLIAELSRVMTLEPGDVIATGTPHGVASGMAIPRWLRAGDTFAVDIEGIGRLENPIVAG